MSVFFVCQLSTIFYEDDYDIKLENMESHPDSHGDIVLTLKRMVAMVAMVMKMTEFEGNGRSQGLLLRCSCCLELITPDFCHKKDGDHEHDVHDYDCDDNRVSHYLGERV